MPASNRPPIAVVALGDPKRHDDGLALRVMGRVRTLIAELGVYRATGVPPRRGTHLKLESGARNRTLAAAAARGWERSGARAGRDSLAVAARNDLGSMIEWIEGGTEQQKLDPILGGRTRVVLVDAVRLTGQAGLVHHWHLRCDPASGMSTIGHHNGHFQVGMQHLALWLEDELPERGTDLIGIEPHDLSEGEGLSRPIRARLPMICSQVAAVLLKILEEEGW